MTGVCLKAFARKALLLMGVGAWCVASLAQTNGGSSLTLKTTVSRVLVDVMVRDARGHAVHGLTKDDFKVEEDNRPQTVLSFDAHDFDAGMEYVPPKLPALPADTFVNLPADPERGPLYVLFYDMVNTPPEDQMSARMQLVRFLENKPAGARFAIFVSSDGVHLVQGFTSDKQKLLAAVDPSGKTRHVPRVFLMGGNFGEGDSLAAATRLARIAALMEAIPGRKNLIWFASEFPLSLFPSEFEPQAYREQIKKTIDLLATDQIAVFPVDASALPTSVAYNPPGSVGGDGGVAARAAPASGGGPATSHGTSQLQSSYWVQDAIAQATGGEAVYSTNDLAGALEKVTADAGSYYTLSYSPSDKNFDGRVRHIEVSLRERNDYQLSYRRVYYGTESPAAADATDDALQASMVHGAPESHALIFGVHVGAVGPDAKARMYRFDYSVMAGPLGLPAGTGPQLEVAAAAYDADGRLLNSSVNKAVEDTAAPKEQKRKAYFVEQELDVPAATKYLRFAVRDDRTGKVGALEVGLPMDEAEAKR